MRKTVDGEGLRRFMRAFGAVAPEDGACFLTGGATAVLLGWRESTIDIDIALIPEREALLRAIPRLKEDLEVNVELASPGDFIPLPSGWQERSLFAGREGRLAFYHFDPYAQALAKLERGFAQDIQDVRALVSSGLVEVRKLLACYTEIEPELYRFPAINSASFRRSVEENLGS